MGGQTMRESHECCCCLLRGPDTSPLVIEKVEAHAGSAWSTRRLELRRWSVEEAWASAAPDGALHGERSELRGQSRRCDRTLPQATAAQWCFVSTRRQQFRHWIAKTPSFRSHPDERNGTALSMYAHPSISHFGGGCQQPIYAWFQSSHALHPATFQMGTDLAGARGIMTRGLSY